MRPLFLSVLILATGLPLTAQDEYPESTALLGVRLRPVPLNVLTSVGLSPGAGTMVTRVWPGSAADQIGLQPGDVILNVNGTPIDSRRDVRRTVIEHNAGDDVSISIRRPGSTSTRTLNGQFSNMPEWLEERIHRWIPRMTERWEDHVVARQLARLATEAERLDALEQDIAAAEAQSATLLDEDGLLHQPLQYAASQAVVNDVYDGPAWTFRYQWSLNSNKQEYSCNASSLVHF